MAPTMLKRHLCMIFSDISREYVMATATPLEAVPVSTASERARRADEARQIAAATREPFMAVYRAAGRA